MQIVSVNSFPIQQDMTFISYRDLKNNTWRHVTQEINYSVALP